MDEDLELNRFVKSALEAKPPLRPRGPLCAGEVPRNASESRRSGWLLRSRWRWAAASLLAASVALVATFHAPGRAEATSVEDALLLLAEADGVDLGSGEAQTPGDLLLAWQEAAPAERGDGCDG